VIQWSTPDGPGSRVSLTRFVLAQPENAHSVTQFKEGIRSLLGGAVGAKQLGMPHTFKFPHKDLSQSRPIRLAMRQITNQINRSSG
jgi:hypothetical protein